eukprot:13877940-Heterocapsa_arctica.AAC.1
MNVEVCFKQYVFVVVVGWGAGPSGRRLAIAIRCTTKRCTLFSNPEPKRSNIALKHVTTT